MFETLFCPGLKFSIEYFFLLVVRADFLSVIHLDLEMKLREELGFFVPWLYEISSQKIDFF